MSRATPDVFRFQRVTEEYVGAAQVAYAQILDHLGRTVDYPHWHTAGHPSPQTIQAWAAAGDLYLARVDQGEAAGVVVLNHEVPRDHSHARWTVDAAPQEVLAVHALGVVPAFARRGVARFLLDEALAEARARGCKAVRLDTYVENTPALALYRGYGFTDLGLHRVRYEGAGIDQFHLFEFPL